MPVDKDEGEKKLADDGEENKNEDLPKTILVDEHKDHYVKSMSQVIS